MMPFVVITMIISVELLLILLQMDRILMTKKIQIIWWRGGYRELNETTYESGKFVLLSNSQNYGLILDGIRNKLCKQGVNAKKTKKQDLNDELQKAVEDKVPNSTD